MLRITAVRLQRFCSPLALKQNVRYCVTTQLVNTMTLHMARLKTATLNLRLDPELKALAERAATSDQRTLTSLIEKLLTDHLKAKGYMSIPKHARRRN